MTRRSIAILAFLGVGFVPVARSQMAVSRQPSAVSAESRRLMADGWRRDVPHYGKWLTAAGVAAFSIVAATEHRLSRRDWNSLLAICRSALDACTVGADGRYVRADAEALYQRSRAYDRRANRWLVGAQVSLIATTALFIIDLHPGQGPENIPFPANQLEVGLVGGGVGVVLRFPF
jgi:hypothetical protein